MVRPMLASRSSTSGDTWEAVLSEEGQVLVDLERHAAGQLVADREIGVVVVVAEVARVDGTSEG